MVIVRKKCGQLYLNDWKAWRKRFAVLRYNSWLATGMLPQLLPPRQIVSYNVAYVILGSLHATETATPEAKLCYIL